MTRLPPSPFLSDSVVSLATDAAAASKRPPVGAAANPISESPTATGGSRKHRRRPHKAQHSPPGFDLAEVSPPIPCDPASKDHRFVLDAELFEMELDPAPLFLQAAQ